MRERFRTKKFSTNINITLASTKQKWTANLLEILNYTIKIIDEYATQDIKLTLRQLYYQLVARGIIPNDINVYKKMSDVIADARYAGLIDWNMIEDRTRVSEIHSEWDDISDLLDSAMSWYRLDRWKGQKYYIELLTEKDALASIFYPIANKRHIRFNVNRGYLSASNCYTLAKRIAYNIMYNKKKVILLYAGDHDPSGLDMINDIQKRIVEFLTEGNYDADIEQFKIIPIMLTKEQIDKYSPPPNPAKMKDPRSSKYVEKHGETSWEVDALKPEVMIKIVNDEIKKYVDVDMMNAIIEQEKKDMIPLKKFQESLMFK